MPDLVTGPPTHTAPRHRGRFWALAQLASLVLAACGDLTGAGCTRELRAELRPQGEQQIAVGDGFTASITLSSCGGRERLNDAFTWSARDTLVLRVEPSTGRVIGRRPGSTAVDVRGTRYGQVGTIPIAVR